MKMNWVMKATLAMCGIFGMVAASACGSTTAGTAGAGGDTGTTSGCTSDSDCAPDETCTSGECAFAGCLADTDCLAGETCDTSTGSCMGTPTTEPACKQCACTDTLAMGGCANVCDSAQNGNPGTPNFCNGVNALPQCAKCLSDNCGGITDPPNPTDPTACM